MGASMSTRQKNLIYQVAVEEAIRKTDRDTAIIDLVKCWHTMWAIIDEKKILDQINPPALFKFPVHRVRHIIEKLEGRGHALKEKQLKRIRFERDGSKWEKCDNISFKIEEDEWKIRKREMKRERMGFQFTAEDLKNQKVRDKLYELFVVKNVLKLKVKSAKTASNKEREGIQGTRSSRDENEEDESQSEEDESPYSESEQDFFDEKKDRKKKNEYPEVEDTRDGDQLRRIKYK